MNTKESDIFGEVIYAYTRKQAIADGVLVDISEMAREVGIRFPVATTETVWQEYIVPDETLKNQGQSVSGRLWDLLWMFRCKAAKSPQNELSFAVYFLLPNQLSPTLIKLRAHCGPGDQGEPVITIMQPHED